MQYVAGLDGGGTKTAVTVLSTDKKLQKTAVFGAMNLNGSAVSEVKRTIYDCLQWLATSFGGLENFSAICIGSAGISNPDAKKLLTSTVLEHGYAGNLLLLGDHEIALEGALSGRDGAILIAGTGSICVEKSDGNIARAGGFGHLIDDEGSGYAIGRDILTYVVRSFDARNQNTCLTQALFKLLQITDISQLIRFIYQPWLFCLVMHFLYRIVLLLKLQKKQQKSLQILLQV